MTRYHYFLLSAFLVAWVWAAINPLFPADWLIENILVFILVPIVVVSGRRFKFSNLSYGLITLFAILHLVGSHYTYAFVPFGFTLQDLLGSTRNMYDRLVHFSFGFLLVYPIYEFFKARVPLSGFWSYYFAVELVLATSGLYEVIEWVVGAGVDPEAGIAFLGAQGDIWDSQKDMALATTGAFIVMASLWAYSRNKKQGRL